MNVKEYNLAFLKYEKELHKHILLKSNHNNLLTEDVFQDCYMKGYNAIKEGKYQERGFFLTWLKHLASNLIIDKWRDSVKRKKFISNNSDSFNIFNFIIDPFDFEADIERREDFKRLSVAIKGLSKRQQYVINKATLDGVLFKDLSKEMGVSINTLLGSKRYAVINLRKKIK